MKFRPGKTYRFSDLPQGSGFRLTMDGRYGWLAMRKKDPTLPPGNFIKVDDSQYAENNGQIRLNRLRTAVRGFVVEFLEAPLEY